MSNNISKLWTYQTGVIGDKEVLETEDLKQTESRKEPIKIAIDIMPLAYKYLYVGDMKSPRGPLRSGEIITSYIYHLINYVLRLRALNIEPYICLDHHSALINPLKNELIEVRASGRLKIVDSFQEKIAQGQMLPQDWFRYNCAKYYISSKNVDLLEMLFSKMGLKVLRIPGIEAQSLCAYLKKKGLVDYCFSVDKDITLYGVDALIHCDPDTGSYIFFDYKKNLQQVGLKTHDLVLDCAIASGTDYSKGLPKVGPITAIKQALRNPQELGKVLDETIGAEKRQAIKDLFKNHYDHATFNKLNQTISYDQLTKPEPDLQYLQNLLTDLNFSERTIHDVLNKLNA